MKDNKATSIDVVLLSSFLTLNTSSNQSSISISDFKQEFAGWERSS